MIIRIQSRKPDESEPASTLTLTPMCVRIPARPMRVLDFDVEARPLHWISGDYVSKEITAIAWQVIGEPDSAQCWLLGECEPTRMLRAFVAAYDACDMVTGHYIRGYDLPMVNGALTEYGMTPLGDKLSQDTKLDLVRRQGLSNSQENIGAMLKLHHPKVKMDQAAWRDANRLTPEGRMRTRERVIGDVLQHIEMRQRLLELGYLTAPRIWKSNSDAPDYTP